MKNISSDQFLPEKDAVFITKRVLWHVFIMILSLWLPISCRRYNTQQSDKNSENLKKQQSEALMQANQLLVEKEAEEIDAYIKRKGWSMQMTESGLHYMVYQKGQGTQAQPGKTIELAYTLSLLNGSVCYSSESSGIKQFKNGEGGVETGLEEGVLLLREGDKAYFVMPSHLGHGLSGDGICIPSRAIIIYDVEMLHVK